MTKKFEVGSYAINNKGIGIAGPQSTIYKVVSIENVTSGVNYVILQKRTDYRENLSAFKLLCNEFQKRTYLAYYAGFETELLSPTTGQVLQRLAVKIPE